MALPSADDFDGVLLAALPVSALPADREAALAQWSPLQAQLIVVKELGVLKKTEETMLFNLFFLPLKKIYLKIIFQRLFWRCRLPLA